MQPSCPICGCLMQCNEDAGSPKCSNQYCLSRNEKWEKEAVSLIPRDPENFNIVYEHYAALKKESTLIRDICVSKVHIFFPNDCRMNHEPIGFRSSEGGEGCPLCQAQSGIDHLTRVNSELRKRIAELSEEVAIHASATETWTEIADCAGRDAKPLRDALTFLAVGHKDDCQCIACLALSTHWLPDKL